MSLDIGTGGKHPEELGNKGEVGLLDKISRVQHPFCYITVNGELLSNQPLGGLSMISTPLKVVTLEQIPPIIELWSKGNPRGTIEHIVQEATDGGRRNVHLAASN